MDVSGAAAAALDFIEDKDGAGLFGEAAQGAQIVVVGHAYAGNALYAFYNHGAVLARLESLAGGLDVVESNEVYRIGAVEGRLDCRIVGCGDSARCAAVKGLADSQKLAASVGERGQFDGVFVCLGTRVAQEETIVVIAAELAEKARPDAAGANFLTELE